MGFLRPPPAGGIENERREGGEGHKGEGEGLKGGVKGGGEEGLKGGRGVLRSIFSGRGGGNED